MNFDIESAFCVIVGDYVLELASQSAEALPVARIQNSLACLSLVCTGGDVSVYLPREKVLYSGDMMFAGISWLGDGYVNEWPETLERAKALDFELVVPGHGPPFSDRGRIDLVQAYYRDLWAGVAALHGQGVDAETAAATVDLTAHGALGVEDVGADPLAVQRIYFLLEETLLEGAE